MTKPAHGGLWTAPVTPAGTTWTDWLRRHHPQRLPRYLTRIVPLPAARILHLNSEADLVAAAARYGCPEPWWPTCCLNWPAMTADGWDAIHLTERGLLVSHAMPDTDGELSAWDVPCVLWLAPSYALGPTTALSTSNR